ncbi:MAG: TIGR02679 family protein [Aliidongia sp.]
MSDHVDARLHRLLGGAQLAALRKRLRQRFERAALDEAVDQIRVTGLNAEEHAALAALTGRPPRRTKSLLIDVRRVDADLLRSGIAASLRDALEQLDGRIRHLAEYRRQQRTLWSDVVGGCKDPNLSGLLLTPDGLGLLKRLARQDASAAAGFCRCAEAVLQHLPAQGVTRSQLAATVLGDAHALDSGRAIATLVLAVWRRTAAPVPDEGDDCGVRQALDPERTGSVERVRDTWARAGVLVNELARPALFLNLPIETGADRWPAGEPAYASLRSLLRSPPRWAAAGRDIYVCENPNLLAIAADRWGAACAPMICTDGMPAAAQQCLLSQLVQAGAQLHYHGDFDWPGVHIGNHVMREHGAKPWRFGAADYLAAVRTAPSQAQSLGEKTVEASWDEALSRAMQEQRIAIAEEAVAGSLLQDLDDRL